MPVRQAKACCRASSGWHVTPAARPRRCLSTTPRVCCSAQGLQCGAPCLRASPMALERSPGGRPGTSLGCTPIRCGPRQPCVSRLGPRAVLKRKTTPRPTNAWSARLCARTPVRAHTRHWGGHSLGEVRCAVHVQSVNFIDFPSCLLALLCVYLPFHVFTCPSTLLKKGHKYVIISRK